MNLFTPPPQILYHNSINYVTVCPGVMTLHRMWSVKDVKPIIRGIDEMIHDTDQRFMRDENIEREPTRSTNTP